MRLDKLISDAGVATRKEAAAAVRAGQATVNGTVVREPDRKVDPGRDTVVFRGPRASVFCRRFTQEPRACMS